MILTTQVLQAYTHLTPNHIPITLPTLHIYRPTLSLNRLKVSLVYNRSSHFTATVYPKHDIHKFHDIHLKLLKDGILRGFGFLVLDPMGLGFNLCVVLAL